MLLPPAPVEWTLLNRSTIGHTDVNLLMVIISLCDRLLLVGHPAYSCPCAYQVGLKGQPPILEGQLSKSVQPEECLWSLDNSAIEMTLQKSDRMTWWKNIVEGEPAIDTSKVPSSLYLTFHILIDRNVSRVQYLLNTGPLCRLSCSL